MPFPLRNIRICDLTRYLAGAGASRLLAGLGAEVIKIEWKDNLPATRFGMPRMSVGELRQKVDRGERVDVLVKPDGTPNQSGLNNETNAGKRGASLNIRDARGKELLRELISISDVVIENMRATMMEKWGLGYEELRKIRPDIIYYQQSGFGRYGLYEDYVSTGPVAQTFAGLTEMSGLPDPYPPAGWGMSYMDWNGAYCGAMAVGSALFYRRRTGKGQYIDGSQVELGIGMTGTAILDYTVNGRRYQRTGNSSPHKLSAPHGIYRCRGVDRWIAIAVYDETEWKAFCTVIGDPAWASEPRFATLETRAKHQEALDRLLETATRDWNAYDLMAQLQAAGVRAGVCQNTEDRVEHDPQLKHDGFLVNLPTRDYGAWPVKDFPVKLRKSPAHQGSTINRGAPAYAEDNQWLYTQLLGRSLETVERLAGANVI